MDRAGVVAATTGFAKGEKPAKSEKPAKPAQTQPPSPAKPAGDKPTMAETAAPETTEIPLIGIEDFQKIQLRAARVLSAARHPSADRLLVLSVDVGEPEPRTIVAGIAGRYTPEDLVGLTVVAILNLKPVKLRGVMSQGMLLAAGGGEVKGMVTVTDPVAPGTIVR
jgi:methionyl-tRNA synthetase